MGNKLFTEADRRATEHLDQELHRDVHGADVALIDTATPDAGPAAARQWRIACSC